MKKTMRSLAPVLALSLAVGLLAGCSGSGEASDTTAAGQEGAETTAEAGGSGDASGSAKDTLIIATANETPSVTTNLHNAVARRLPQQNDPQRPVQDRRKHGGCSGPGREL